MAIFVAADNRAESSPTTDKITTPISASSTVYITDAGTGQTLSKTLQQILDDVKTLPYNFNGYYLVALNVDEYYILPVKYTPDNNKAYIGNSPFVAPSASDVWKGYAGVANRNDGGAYDYYYNYGTLVNRGYSWSGYRSDYRASDNKYYSCFAGFTKNGKWFPSVIVVDADTCYINGEQSITDIIGTGGGATHIAKVTGLLSTLESNLSDILIVAGGGGGGLIKEGTAYRGSDAGGMEGNGDNSAGQSTGYAFGQGDEGCGGGLYGGNKAT